MAPMPKPKIDSTKIQRETIWRLVDARCKQLADVVSAARIPFLLALTWSLIWTWALFTTEYGYVNTYKSRYMAISALMESDAEEDRKKFARLCAEALVRKDLFATVFGEQVEPSKDFSDKYCKRLVGVRREFAEKQELDSTMILFPGGFAKVHVSDLGIVGNLAIILILFWAFYALRRENHAVRSFVDIVYKSRLNEYWYPKKFNLVPQGELFSAEHFAYAYQAVSQRFVFVFSQNSRPLLLTTTALCMFPATVSFFNLFADVRDVARLPFERSVYFRVLVELGLFGIVAILTSHIVKFVVDTSVLLNAWHLAVRDVWIKDWDESNEEPAPTVTIDALAQEARIADGDSHNRATDQG
jgi:hypothetical protein